MLSKKNMFDYRPSSVSGEPVKRLRVAPGKRWIVWLTDRNRTQLEMTSAQLQRLIDTEPKHIGSYVDKSLL